MKATKEDMGVVEDQTLGCMCMDLSTIMEQLASMRENAESFLISEDADPIWQNDIDAIDAVSAIIQVLQDEDIADPEALKDMIYDYRELAKQYRAMHLRYEVAIPAVRTGALWRCPVCGHRLRFSGRYCGYCGQKIQ